MADASEQPGGEQLSAQVEMAKKRLEEATTAASAAERRVAAEIEALESDLEKERARATQALEALREAHAEELQRERDAKERVIAEAESRLAEIETQTAAAEKQIEEVEERARQAEGRALAAEKRAAEAEAAIADEHARAREAAAAWLRNQVEAAGREEGRR
jgi:predicted  nucleic acid-binding Zn-ribbon protein